MRPLATSSSAWRSMRSLGTTATRHGVTAQPVPPVPPELASWTQSDEVLDVAGRLLE